VAFLRLGCLSFGGPVAHLGYFHAELVERRGWCSGEEYAETVALAQSLPGPASSQVAFALGLYRGGWAGGLAAWGGFTLPSALLLFAFACGHALFAGVLGVGILHGLQLVAVAIVAQAVLTMRRSLAPDNPRIALAVFAAALALLLPSPVTTLGIIGGTALIGLMMPSALTDGLVTGDSRRSPVTGRNGRIAGALFVGLLVLAPVVARTSHAAAVFSAFYRTGALVFGGGHVVLPLLQGAVVAPGWVDEQSFLAGYGAAQAVPGPLFTFAAYLGAVMKDPATGAISVSLLAREAMAAVALIAIFLPGLLLMAAVLPVWAGVRRNPRFQSALRLVNAGVVGILGAALVRPVATTALHSWRDVVIAAAALFALTRLKAPPWTVVVSSAVLGGIRSIW